MGRKFFIFIVIIIILAAGGYYLFKKNKAQAPSDVQPTQDQSASGQGTVPPATQIEPPVTPPTNSGSNATTSSQAGVNENSIDGNNVAVVEVDFDGTKFTPAVTNINAGDWVFFKNKSTVDFWPASDPHPTHTDYPGFDALKPIAPGGEYKFQFTKVGNWGYHDHLDPSIQGTISVK